MAHCPRQVVSDALSLRLALSSSSGVVGGWPRRILCQHRRHAWHRPHQRRTFCHDASSWRCAQPQIATITRCINQLRRGRTGVPRGPSGRPTVDGRTTVSCHVASVRQLSGSWSVVAVALKISISISIANFKTNSSFDEYTLCVAFARGSLADEGVA